MYRLKIWDDSWDIHRNDAYSSFRYDSKDNANNTNPSIAYNELKYSNKELSSVYNSSKALEEEKRDIEQDTLSSIVEEERQKGKNKEGDIIKAGNRLFAESAESKEEKKAKREVKSVEKSIEEAINQAIKEEKEVIVLG